MTSAPDTDPGAALSLREVRKAFPGQVALAGVDLDIGRGEVHGLVGQNGSGKSTLIKILAGFHGADRGSRAWVDGQPFHLGSAQTAEQAGMRFVHQDLGLVPTLNAPDNLALGHGFASNRWVRMGVERTRAQQAIRALGVDIDCSVPVGDLQPVERTLLAMARALLDRDDLRILVLDEPSESLGQREVAVLFDAIRAVASRGAAVLYVSHRLEEVLEITERVTVLRDGRVVATKETAELDHDRLVRLIIGRNPDRLFDHGGETPPAGEAVVKARNVAGTRITGLDLEIRSGEILGVAGLYGSGREELPYLIAGARPLTAGEVEVGGRRLAGGSSRRAMQAGVVLVAADRSRESAILDMSVRENVTLSRMESRGPLRWLNARRERRAVMPWIERLSVRPTDPDRRLQTLSGGNQQKVVLSRALRCGPRALVVDEPVQGVDVEARGLIYEALQDSARDGMAVMVCSSDFDELCGLCDRVLVLRRGRLAAELTGSESSVDRITQESLGSAYAGRA